MISKGISRIFRRLARERKALAGELDRLRKLQRGELESRFCAYEPRSVPVGTHEQRMRALKLPYPSPAEIVAEAEAEARSRLRALRTQASDSRDTQDLELEEEEEEPFFVEEEAAAAARVTARARRRRKQQSAESARGAAAARFVKKPRKKAAQAVPGAYVAQEMREVALSDATQQLPMHLLPANPEGLVDERGRAVSVKTLGADTSVGVLRVVSRETEARGSRV